jgi:hypothetical protein
MQEWAQTVLQTPARMLTSMRALHPNLISWRCLASAAKGALARKDAGVAGVLCNMPERHQYAPTPLSYGANVTPRVLLGNSLATSCGHCGAQHCEQSLDCSLGFEVS